MTVDIHTLKAGDRVIVADPTPYVTLFAPGSIAEVVASVGNDHSYILLTNTEAIAKARVKHYSEEDFYWAEEISWPFTADEIEEIVK